MNGTVRVAALALSLGGCTSLLGIDGTYEVEGGGGATSAALTAVGSTGAGGDGAGGAASNGSAVGVGGQGGGAACPVCRATRELTVPDGRAPRVGRSHDELWLTYLTGEEGDANIGVMNADESASLAPAPDVVDAVLPGLPSDGGPVWLSGSQVGSLILWQDGAVLAEPLGAPPIDASLVGDALYVVGRDEEERPHLFSCNVEGCFPTRSCPSAEGAWAALAADGTVGFFALHCEGQLVVTDLDGTPQGKAASVPSGPLAMAARAGEHAVAVVENPGEEDATVWLLSSGAPVASIPVPGARAPAIAWGASGVVVAFEQSEDEQGSTIGVLHCTSASDGCSVHALTGVEPGAAAPSLGAVQDDVWIAWQEDGSVVVGQLVP